MTTELQKAYMRGYAKGRAFKKVSYELQKDYMIEDLSDVTVDSSRMFGSSFSVWQKIISFLRNGLSLSKP